MIRPRTRLFDVFGVLSVIAWVAVIAAYVYGTYFVEFAKPQGGAVFEEGESYMLLTREDEEVGYIHETRTHVWETDSWLLEYDLMMNVSMLGIDQYLQTNIKATVDEFAFLKDFSGTIETAGTSFELSGKVDGKTVTMKMDLAGQPQEQKLELNDRPRLSNSALNELVGSPDLKPGTVFEQEYFDPTKMGMTTMVFEFVNRRTITVYDEDVEAFHFRQRVGGTELDAYVNEKGEVQLQEFPLRIVGARVPNVLGRSRALAMNEEYEKSAGRGVNVAAADGMSLESVVGLVQAGTLNSVTSSQQYRLAGDVTGVDLESLQQKVASRTEAGVVIETSTRGDAAIDKASAPLDGLLADDERLDIENEIFGTLLAEDAPASDTLRAEAIARSLRQQLKVGEATGAESAAAILKAGTGDVRERTLVIVAALRHHGIPARFVSGVKVDADGKFAPHYWAQYWDGEKYFADVDLSSLTMLPGSDQVQLFTHSSPDPPEQLASIVSESRITQVKGDPKTPKGVKSDFN